MLEIAEVEAGLAFMGVVEESAMGVPLLDVGIAVGSVGNVRVVEDVVATAGVEATGAGVGVAQGSGRGVGAE